MLSTEFHANSAHSVVTTADGLAPKDPLNLNLSTAGLGKSLDSHIDEHVSRWVKGGSSRAKLAGDVGNNRLVGSSKSDKIWGNSGDDLLKGGNGNDRLYGESGNDNLYGESGKDTLVGGSGNDYLEGGSDKDTLTGESGNDKFVISAATRKTKLSSADVITDFTDGQDRLKLQGGLQFSRLSISQGTDKNVKDTLIRDKSTGDYLAVLKNVSSSLISSADFSDLPGSPTPTPTPAPAPSPSPAPKPTPTPSAGVLAFSTAGYSIGEGGGTATITVNRAGGSAGQIKVNFATIAGGTAQAGSDYTSASGTLTFASGQTSKTFTVPITNDTAAEGNETIKLALTNPVGGGLGTQTTATVTIVDNDTATPTPPAGGGGGTGSAAPASIVSGAVKFNPGESEAAIAAKGAARIKIGTQTIYIGSQQVTSVNQNPIIASFDSANPANNWVKTNYEATGADGRGYGLFWDGSSLYGAFSVDGTQGTPSQDFRRAAGGATQAWLRSYGQGGGAKIAVLAKIDPKTGEMSSAAHLSSRLANGKSNSMAITNLSVNANGNLVVKANSWYAPRRPDGSMMTQTTTGNSPFAYTLEMSRDLKTVISTSAVGWS